jgi:hypothetical protein
MMGEGEVFTLVKRPVQRNTGESGKMYLVTRVLQLEGRYLTSAIKSGHNLHIVDSCWAKQLYSKTDTKRRMGGGGGTVC